jgi:hypothetical protein
MLKFKIEQVAICPNNAARAMQLLQEMGANDWANDIVVASGKVWSQPGENTAALAFNYQLIDGKEFEVLDYQSGPNWMNDHSPSVSHFGMHVEAEELEQWRAFFAERNIEVAQEVVTTSHTNPVIAGKRNYNYVIFATRHILGVDIKFIVRIDK